MPNETPAAVDIPALRALAANVEICNSELSYPVEDPGCYVPISEFSALLDAADERENLRRNLDRSRRRSVEIAEQMQADHNKTRAAIRTALADLKIAIDGNTTVRGMAKHAEAAYRTLTASLAGETFDV